MPASEPVRLGRKRALPPCPNPLFHKWLTELRDEAKEKGLKIHYTYQKALNSLSKYPLPLQNAKEAKILQNFGDGICKILDSKLQKYYRENGPDAPIHALPEGVLPPGRPENCSLAPPTQMEAGGDGGKDTGDKDGDRKKKKKREYIPQKRSGGYAVLLTLYRHSQIPGNKGFMFKMELQAEAQRLCDKSFTVPDLGSKYTAWSSVATLISKNLLLKTHNPARFSLTDEGQALAERLESAEQDARREEARSEGQAAAEEEEEPVDLTLRDEEEGKDPKPPADAPAAAAAAAALGRSEESGASHSGWSLPAGSYEVILCIDFIETTGGSSHRKQELVRELQRNGVQYDIRKLNVGDFLWVAREKLTPVPGRLQAPVGRELVLDYIVERKRMDDLCGSIIDGRFREQKFRLKRCGLRHPVYLVEGIGMSAFHLSLPESTLLQAVVNTQVVDGFFVKRVQDTRESAAYLTIMTRYLAKLYQSKTLRCRSRELEGDGGEELGVPSCSLMSFAEFNYGAVKNKCQTVREVFARQLMQISGLSGDKAAAILEIYSTPNSLLTAYEACETEAEKEKLLASIQCGKLKRKLGPALSRTVYQLYCSEGALS